MSIRVALTLLAAGVAASARPARADVPRAGVGGEKVVASPRLAYPSEAEVLRALPRGPPRRNVRILYEVQVHRAGPPRLYPLAGLARLVEVQLKCTVVSDRGREVVYID